MIVRRELLSDTKTAAVVAESKHDAVVSLTKLEPKPNGEISALPTAEKEADEGKTAIIFLHEYRNKSETKAYEYKNIRREA